MIKTKHMLKRTLMAFMTMVLFVSVASAQRFYTKTGKITFYSKAPLEDIEATNRTVSAAIDSKTGAIQFSVQMKGFEFEKKMMQEHFNENYVESDKYPKSEFRGTITNNSEIDYTKDGTYTAKVKGKLTIHGVTKDVETTGTIKVRGGKIDVSSDFNVLVSDYEIKIPAVVKDKVSNSVKIVVDCTMEPLKS